MKKIIFAFILFASLKGITQCVTPMTYSIQVTPESCNGCCDGAAQVVNLQGGCPPYMYVWSQGSNTGPVNGLCTGSYTLTIYNNCCPSVSQSCFIAQSGTATNIKENNLEVSVSIYPNPNNGQFIVNISETKLSNALLKIYDVNGRIVYEQELKDKANQLYDLQVELNNGIYLIEVSDVNSNMHYKQKIVITD